MRKLKFLALASTLLAACSQVPTSDPQPSSQTPQPQALNCGQGTINWSGRTWTVKNSAGSQVGPGPNVFDPANVCQDTVTGNLVLRLTNTGGVWRSAELTTQQNLGLGSYTWTMIGDFSTIDRNVVLGLFPYSTVTPAGASSPDGFKELDIEFARWGDPARGPVNYTVYPGTKAGQTALLNSPYNNHTKEGQSFHHEFAQNLGGTYTTHRITRSSSFVIMEGFHGHTTALSNRFRCVKFSAVPQGASMTLQTEVRVGSGALTSSTLNLGNGLSAADFISSESMPLHMNLWLFRGYAPSNNQGVQFEFPSFTFSSTAAVTGC